MRPPWEASPSSFRKLSMQNVTIGAVFPKDYLFPVTNTLDYHASLISSCTFLTNPNSRQTSPFTISDFAPSPLNKLPNAMREWFSLAPQHTPVTQLQQGHPACHPIPSWLCVSFPQHLGATFLTLLEHHIHLTILTVIDILTSSLWDHIAFGMYYYCSI